METFVEIFFLDRKRKKVRKVFALKRKESQEKKRGSGKEKNNIGRWLKMQNS